MSDEITGTADDKLSAGFVRAARTHLTIPVQPVDTEALIVTVTCPLCGVKYDVTVPPAGFLRWRDGGGGLTHCLGEMTEDQQQQLVSGIDDACWERFFSGGEEGAKQIISHLMHGMRRRYARDERNTR